MNEFYTNELRLHMCDFVLDGDKVLLKVKHKNKIDYCSLDELQEAANKFKNEK